MDEHQFGDKMRIALELAREEVWDHPIPKPPGRLSVLLRMLADRFPSYLNEEADKLSGELLSSSHELALRLDEFDALTLGFAMRTQRFVKRSFDRNLNVKPDR